MARIQKIESDSSFANSNILPGTIMTWKSLEGDRIKYMAKKPDGSVVEITPKVDFSTSFSLSNYYTKDEVDGFIGQLSNSLGALKEDLHSNYYTKLQTYNKEQVNALVAGISTSLSLSNYYDKSQTDALLAQKYDLSDAQALQEDVQDLQWTALQQITFSSISQGVYTIDRPVAVIGIYNNSGRYFPIQKGSVQYSNSSTLVSLTPYLAYSNMSTFSGTWKLLIANTGNRE